MVVGSVGKDKISLPTLLWQTSDPIDIIHRYENQLNHDHLELRSDVAEYMNGTASKDTAIANTGRRH